jgi:hypothetical protein
MAGKLPKGGVKALRKERKGGSMIQSPCLNCPNRFKDKRLCMDSCVLLHRVQTIQAGCLDRSLYTAVDSADEARYQLMSAYDSTRAGVDSLSLY